MHIEVVTPQGTALQLEADELTAPGLRGEFGVLPGHTPFLTALRAGVLTWKQKGQGARKPGVLAIGAGYAEVSGHDRVIVLTQHAAAVEAQPPAVQAIDPAAAQRELDEADRALREPRPAEGGPSREELEAKRAWAQARLDAKKLA